MTKKILFTLFTFAVLSGCSNSEKAQENALLDSVKSVHDKVMADDDQNMRVRTKLKQLLAIKPELKDSVDFFLKKLDDNDNVMMDWMNKFNPDFTGKSHEQIISYLNTQKKQIVGVDSLMKSGTRAAVDFILKSKQK
ncbi:MAG: hypothetical protein ACTHNW_15975 [Mucilaginibacter sp.]